MGPRSDSGAEIKRGCRALWFMARVACPTCRVACLPQAGTRRICLFRRFPQFFRIPPLPQTLSLRQVVPHCVNPATPIRITNKLSLTALNPRAIILFDSSSSSSTADRRPVTLRAQSNLTFLYSLSPAPACSACPALLGERRQAIP